MSKFIEEWRAVVGYEGLYQVSSLGGILSIKRNGTRGGAIAGVKAKDGYVYFKACRGNKYKRIAIHRIVAMAFHGECPPGFECAHLNGERGDNRAENLKWASKKENQSHREIHGTKCIGEKNHFSKITEEVAIEILKLKVPTFGSRHRNAKYLFSQSEVAKKFGVSRQLVSGIWSGKIWSHLSL